MSWESFFAWFPVRTIGGQLVWLSKAERRWNNDLNWWGDFSGHAGTDGGYEYRLPLTGLIK